MTPPISTGRVSGVTAVTGIREQVHMNIQLEEIEISNDWTHTNIA